MKAHILTVNVAEYFHSVAMRGVVREKHWDRLEPRLERNLELILDLLRHHRAHATFFVYGRLAELGAGLVQHIVADGHEVASRGYLPRRLDQVPRAQFLAEIDRAKEALEAAGANAIVGFRAPEWLRERHLWLLDELAARGYLYDASVNPSGRMLSHRTDLHALRLHRLRDGQLWELPIATVGALGLRLAISGGNYSRQLPHKILKRLVAWKSERQRDPLVFYLHTWELDSDEPRIRGLSTFQRVRHYRRLGKTRWVFAHHMSRYRFAGVGEVLGLAQQNSAPHGVSAPEPQPQPEPEPEESGAASLPDRTGRGLGLGHGGEGAREARPVTLVVPMHNEQETLRYLARTLSELCHRLHDRYRLHFLLVDDGSTDDTAAQLDHHFGGLDDCRILHLPVNGGVAAAIHAGIREAETEWVGSIDCDCSYDPWVLEEMLPMLERAEMATASPYHPEGMVYNVPGWRLFLSKTLSRLYSLVLGQRFYTYTSCCRVYRRRALLPHEPEHGGFLGIAEMLLALQRAGGRILEHPAALESRLLGESKMKVGRTILGHLGLLRQAAVRRANTAGVPVRRGRGAAS